MSLVLRYAARSDRGLVRTNNEDSVYAGARLLALADGMGGHAAGEVASNLVITALAPLDNDEPGGDILTKLADAMYAGNDAIAEQVEEEPELDGMGTTLTAILFAGDRIGVCHVGDSRGYMLRDGVLEQITKDDTFVQTLVDAGKLTPDEAHTHPQRSLIMKALTGTEVEPTLTVREAHPGDRYLLCSDGLSDVVTFETIAETLASEPEQRQCANRLIELALRGGGPDNVTVVVADVVDIDYGQNMPIYGGAAGGDDEDYIPDPSSPAGRAAALRPPKSPPRRIKPKTPEPPKRSSKKWWIVGALALVVLAALGVGGYLWLTGMKENQYYVGLDDKREIVIRKGAADSTPVQRACIDPAPAAGRAVTFVDAAAGCGTSRVLTAELLTSQVEGEDRPRTEDEAHEYIRNLATTTRTCAPKTSAPSPAPTRGSGEPRQSPDSGSGVETPRESLAPGGTSAAPSTPQSPVQETTCLPPTS